MDELTLQAGNLRFATLNGSRPTLCAMVEGEDDCSGVGGGDGDGNISVYF